MKLPKLNVEEPSTGTGPAAPRRGWNTVLTATPVILTVLATILAGLSSKELTLSQYYRALAAQNQSKAGDQWNFFQAKRSRRTNHENTADLLQAHVDGSKLDGQALEARAAFFRQRFGRAETDVNQLLDALTKAKDELGTSTTAFQQAVLQLQQAVRELTQQADAAQGRLREVLARPGIEAAWPYLNGNARPQAAVSAPSDAWIPQARQVIQSRQPEEESRALFRGIPEEELRRALATVEANVQAVEHAYDPISEALARLAQVVEEQLRLARRFERAVATVETAALDLPNGTEPAPAAVRTRLATLTRSGQLVASSAEALHADFRTAWHGYQARRYREEADYNRQAAEMYEIQVRRNSVFAERHRDRSKNFFYGMLAAQAGVTIATFSLAVKHKSLLWGLASLAGTGAIVFGAYVHFYM